MSKLYEIPLDDPDVWEMLCQGYTKGVFQLEGYALRSWTKKFQPRNISELSDLISIVRPGTLDVIVDGKSMTQRYVDRKHGKEEVKSQFPVLDDILKDTYQIMVYQEQTMQIAQKIAGYDLVQADKLRKAMGTKDAKIMAELEVSFIDGCKKVGLVSEEDAKTIFGQIRAAQRYSFNKSHGISYALTTYWSAYVKQKNPLKFFLTSLQYAKYKMKKKIEIRDLINEAKKFNIEIRIPTISDFIQDKEYDFYDKDNIIYFGLNNIKGVGSAKINKITENILKLGSTNWTDILLKVNIDKTAITNLISVGFFGTQRRRMLHEYNSFSQLNDREKIGINQKDHQSFLDGLKYLITLDKKNNGPWNETRLNLIKDIIKTLENPSYNLKDDPLWVFETESELLGCSISYNKTDTVSIDTDTQCSDILNGKTEKCAILVEVSSCKEYTVKRGKNKGQPMGAFTASDETGIISCLIFGENYLNSKNKLYDESLVIIKGKRSKDAFIVDSVEQA